MAIIIDEKKKIFHLQTTDTSYVFSIVKDEVLVHLYYGAKKSDPFADWYKVRIFTVWCG